MVIRLRVPRKSRLVKVAESEVHRRSKFWGLNDCFFTEICFGLELCLKFFGGKFDNVRYFLK